MEVTEPRRLRELKEENRTLKPVVANQMLDIQMLKDVVIGKYDRPQVVARRLSPWSMITDSENAGPAG